MNVAIHDVDLVFLVLPPFTLHHICPAFGHVACATVVVSC